MSRHHDLMSADRLSRRDRESERHKKTALRRRVGAAWMSARACHQRLALRQPGRRQLAAQQLADAHLEASQGDGFDQVGGQLCQSAPRGASNPVMYVNV